MIEFLITAPFATFTPLESIVDECSARGDRDFVKDALVKKMTGLRIYGYEYTSYIRIQEIHIISVICFK